jgi:hypothetical protein
MLIPNSFTLPFAYRIYSPTAVTNEKRIFFWLSGRAYRRRLRVGQQFVSASNSRSPVHRRHMPGPGPGRLTYMSTPHKQGGVGGRARAGAKRKVGVVIILARAWVGKRKKAIHAVSAPTAARRWIVLLRPTDVSVQGCVFGKSVKDHEQSILLLLRCFYSPLDVVVNRGRGSLSHSCPCTTPLDNVRPTQHFWKTLDHWE